VLVAGDTPLDRERLRERAPRVADLLLTDDDVDALLAEGRIVLLTDRYAPVDQMLLPVFLDRVPN
jgi:hypothetical protein